MRQNGRGDPTSGKRCGLVGSARNRLRNRPLPMQEPKKEVRNPSATAPKIRFSVVCALLPVSFYLKEWSRRTEETMRMSKMAQGRVFNA
jgi:hypothetical protein